MDCSSTSRGHSKLQNALLKESDILRIHLKFIREKTKEYEPLVEINNFSTSWFDGLAFCALIHHFYPHAFDFNSLDSNDRRKNYTIAFKTAKKLGGIAPLLDVEELMAVDTGIDSRCCFTYVQQFFHLFRHWDETKTLEVNQKTMTFMRNISTLEKRIEYVSMDSN